MSNSEQQTASRALRLLTWRSSTLNLTASSLEQLSQSTKSSRLSNQRFSQTRLLKMLQISLWIEERRDRIVERSVSQIYERIMCISCTVRLTSCNQVNCSWGAWVGQWNQCVEGMTYLRNLGGAQCGVNVGQCARVSCSHNCGIFVCNKVSFPTAVTPFHTLITPQSHSLLQRTCSHSTTTNATSPTRATPIIGCSAVTSQAMSTVLPIHASTLLDASKVQEIGLDISSHWARIAVRRAGIYPFHLTIHGE